MTGGGDGAGARWSTRVARTLMVRPNALYWSGKPQINAAKHSILTLDGAGNWPSSKPEHTLGLDCATFSYTHLKPQMVLQASNEAKLHLGRIIGTNKRSMNYKNRNSVLSHVTDQDMAPPYLVRKIT